MAGARNYKYEYETSPRKLKPEQLPNKSIPKKKKSTLDVKKLEKNKAEKIKNEKKKKFKLTLYVCLGFAMLFAMSYRYSLINEQFNNVQKLKKELATIQKENERLQIDVESDLNLSNIEQSAKEMLGMQKLDSRQTIYVALDKKDYVQPAAAQVVITEEENNFQKAISYIKGFFK